MTKPTGQYRRGSRPIYPTITSRGGQALALIVADMKARGEKYAHTSGAVEAALLTEAARRGFAVPEETTQPSTEVEP